jgi:quercetin dioxygenase-like cupin family protein
MRGCMDVAVRTLLLGCLVGPGCAARRSPTIVGAVPGGIDAFLGAHPLADGQALWADEIARTPGASYHLVQVRGAELPHRHHGHDLAVVVLRGEGMLTLDGTPTPLQSGDSAVIPRDRSHWFARRGDETAVALVVFSPALDAPDTVPDSVDAIPGRQ